ncbi:MAG: hypothetical protein F4Y47_05375 [Acidobacteriia bacterium]|nr:hypothetical protein [Terriglobia bacterium]MYK09055.1 hypothetical protein [Terriglobia bacterium]
MTRSIPSYQARAFNRNALGIQVSGLIESSQNPETHRLVIGRTDGERMIGYVTTVSLSGDRQELQSATILHRFDAPGLGWSDQWAIRHPVAT